VRDAVKELKKQGMKDLIIDLEYNGGGYLNAATELAEMLLNTDDMIVYTKGDKSPYKSRSGEATDRW
jgi:carboxyl-terminal processing protease